MIRDQRLALKITRRIKRKEENPSKHVHRVYPMEKGGYAYLAKHGPPKEAYKISTKTGRVIKCLSIDKIITNKV